MGKLAISLIVSAAVLLGAWLGYQAWFAGKPANTPTQEAPAAQGQLYVSVSDAAANMRDITAVDMTVNSIALHSQAQGWVTVSNTPQTFRLIDLNATGKARLAADVSVLADSYDRARFIVSKVTVTEAGQTKTATLPSGELTVAGNIKVFANATSSANLDVLASESLHKTGNGAFIFAPVVKFESRSSARVNVGADKAVTVSGGTVEANVSAGMDVDGTVKTDFKIGSNAKLDVDSSGTIKINL